MEKIVQLTNVTKYYGRGNMVTKALDGISFAVGEGEFTAIMGASGSGKSTLLNVIATIDRVSSGDICIRGKHLPQMKEKDLAVFRREELGFIFQDYNLLDTLTIEENIVLPLNLKDQKRIGARCTGFGSCRPTGKISVGAFGRTAAACSVCAGINYQSGARAGRRANRSARLQKLETLNAKFCNDE